MYLTKQEERILEGEEGEGLQKAMELIVALGDINGAERLINIKSSQVSGVSYKTIGDAGLEFLKEWASKNVKVRVLTTLNPMGVDPENWKEYGFKKEFVDKQLKILNCFTSMGIIPSCTCTPYLAGNLPRFKEHVAWAESSAVVFANSVLGARTNRESGISALACAIVGKTPLYGLHLEENRKPALEIEVEVRMHSYADYSALGYYVAKNFNEIPLFKFKKNGNPNLDELKALSASLGVGAINMFHVKDITPENNIEEKLEKISFDKEELKEVYEELTTCENYDIICIGCPHCSINELREIFSINIKNKNLWIYTAKQNKAFFRNVISDTCMVVSPLEEIGIEAIATNSAKAAFYSQNLSKLEVKFAPLKELLS